MIFQLFWQKYITIVIWRFVDFKYDTEPNVSIDYSYYCYLPTNNFNNNNGIVQSVKPYRYGTSDI